MSVGRSAWNLIKSLGSSIMPVTGLYSGSTVPAIGLGGFSGSSIILVTGLGGFSGRFGRASQC